MLHDHQAYPGWVVLFLKDHAEHLHELPEHRRSRLLLDVADAADAVVRAFQPARLNYECLGNVLAHVHWHVIPRYRPPLDPEPARTVWTRPEPELNCGVSPPTRSEYVARLRQAWTRQPA